MCGCHFSIPLNTTDVLFSLKVGLEVYAHTVGRLRTHSQELVSVIDTRFIVGLLVWLQLLYSSELCRLFLTPSWTGGVHTCFETTKDPQPGIDKYG